MPRRDIRRLIFVAVVFLLALGVIYFSNISIGGFQRGGEKNMGFSLGLDLVGGVHLVYQAQSPSGEPILDDDMEAVKRTIERRASAFGVAEPNIQLLGDDRILVQLPGIDDIDRAVNLIGGTARLEFKKRLCTNEISDVSESYPTDTCKDPKYHTDQEIGLTGDNLVSAFAGTDSFTGKPIVNIEFDDDGTKIFGRVTGEIAGTDNRVAIFLDDDELIAPIAQSAIFSRQSIISGNFTLEEVRDISIQLNSGRLRIPLEIIQREDVDATLGRDSLDKSLLAAYIGFALLAVFMVAYYRISGLLAVLSLAIYGTIVLAVFKLWPVTLTLAGIGGFILSVGMAVDANVLIFERMKEELRSGRTLLSAVDVAFNRAWTAIRDSNVSTFIICAVLWWFGNRLLGSPLVVSFAMTLAIGISVSLFTALMVTRTFLRLIATTRLGRHKSLFCPLASYPPKENTSLGDKN